MRFLPGSYYQKTYYNISEGVYGSYWLGKLVNGLILSGKKKLLDRHFITAYMFLKWQHSTNPVDSFLESLEYVKPVFNSHYIILRGQKKEFPTLLSKDKQFRLTVRWVKNLVQARKEHTLSHRIYLELLAVKDPRRHLLLKRRDDLFMSAVTNRFNLRYSY